MSERLSQAREHGLRISRAGEPITELLFAEIDALRAERDLARDQLAVFTAIMETVYRDRDRLLEALRPFADQAKIIDGARIQGLAYHDVAWFRFGASITAITLGDCRAAAALVAEMDVKGVTP